MASSQKLLELYNRAVELNHPDPERAIFGRAAMTGFDSQYNKDGKAGIFSVDEKRAARLGWDNLESIEESFQAAMELDGRAYDKDGDVGKMFLSTAGTKKDSFLNVLDKSYTEIREKISYEDGVAVGLDLTKKEEGTKEIRLDPDKPHDDIQKDARREVADEVGGGESSASLTRLTTLLKEYIDASV
jgi:hypothetical protein